MQFKNSEFKWKLETPLITQFNYTMHYILFMTV